MDDVCLIAAPRPLRLFTPSSSIHHHHQHHVVVPRTRPIFSPVEAFAKFSLEDSSPTSAIDENDEHSSIDEPESATSSDDSHTRLSLPEETLEEFLAILRPPTALPPFRFNHPYRRGHGTGSAGSGSSGPSAYPYERPHPYRFRKSVSTISSGATEDTSDTRDRRSRRGVEKLSLSRRSEVDTPLTTSADEIIQAEWRNFELGSPISRNQTRNPLPRHPAYEALTANLFVSFQPVVVSPVSPLLRPTRNIIDNAHHHMLPHSHIRPVPNTNAPATEEAVMPPASNASIATSSGQNQ
ncbi:hypothetical protein FRB94_006013 [Tulasnella sp. JGI-2019a]|nr:hypothetical protein FRB94_006013 [Tulasnella sp. JGI-2019a]